MSRIRTTILTFAAVAISTAFCTTSYAGTPVTMPSTDDDGGIIHTNLQLPDDDGGIIHTNLQLPDDDGGIIHTNLGLPDDDGGIIHTN